MAILVGQQYDFQRLQALNLVFHSSASASPPTTPVEGQPWYVTDQDVLKVYTGSVWNPLIVGPASSTSGKIPTWNGSSGGALNDGLLLVTTVGDPGDDTSIPTEQAVREALNAALASEVSFKGGYNANTNTPDLDTSPSGVKIGDMYYVSAAGTFFSEDLEAGDVIISNQNNPTILDNWTRIQRNLPAVIPVSNHNLLDGDVHPDSVTQSVSRGSLIYGNSTPKWDELTLGSVGYILKSDGTDVGWGKMRYCVKLSTSATSYDVVHNLGTRRVLVSCQDLNCQDIKVEWRCKSGAETTTVTVSFGAAPSANTRIITVYGMNFGEALDSAN